MPALPLEIPETLCQVCGYFEQLRFPELPANCEQYGAPIASPAEGKVLCHVCSALLEIVRERVWFICAQAEWEQENIRLANLKREFLH